MIQKKNLLRKQLDTIVDPSDKPYYCGSDCSFKSKGNVEISSDQVKENKKVEEKGFKMLKNF